MILIQYDIIINDKIAQSACLPQIDLHYIEVCSHYYDSYIESIPCEIGIGIDSVVTGSLKDPSP